MNRGRKKKEILSFEDTQKMCLKKIEAGMCLTQDECSYLIDVDDHGTKPTEKRHLTKMAVCNIEKKALEKLKFVLAKKFNIRDITDVFKSGSTIVPAKQSSFGQDND